jgi:hypothetical protein
LWSDRRLQQIVYKEKMKLGFDHRWLLPPPLCPAPPSTICEEDDSSADPSHAAAAKHLARERLSHF